MVRKRRRLELRKTLFLLPNLITLSSIFCGFDSIRISATAKTEDDFYRAALLIVFAMFFDTLDGRVARMTKTQSADHASTSMRRRHPPARATSRSRRPRAPAEAATAMSPTSTTSSTKETATRLTNSSEGVGVTPGRMRRNCTIAYPMMTAVLAARHSEIPVAG